MKYFPSILYIWLSYTIKSLNILISAFHIFTHFTILTIENGSWARWALLAFMALPPIPGPRRSFLAGAHSPIVIVLFGKGQMPFWNPIFTT